MVKITQAHGYTVRALRQLEKKTPKARIRLRLMAVRLVWEGYPGRGRPILSACRLAR